MDRKERKYRYSTFVRSRNAASPSALLPDYARDFLQHGSGWNISNAA